MFYCELCSKEYENKQNFEKHLKSKTHLKMKEISYNKVNKVYECIHCHKQFTTKSNLNRHLKIVCEKSKYENQGLKSQIEKLQKGINDKYQDEIDELKSQLDTINELHKNEIERIEENHSKIVNILNGVIDDYKRTINRQTTELEMLNITNGKLEIENTKLKTHKEILNHKYYN